ncbi:50S ribosomal protein L3 [Candidatus Formimonas warabiya]|uniref:Large ribosomal subunit protein uL3 n=1 Tax=Formimonas warabiya TaxID=1761012 RepID=A0A3G1KXD1_FORW1|nr:50S ribosomal protein L3 [Candidatus Formimonas warabiya]ATW27116.1 50S ribosomal protein L3 [Candidatus Formimonas warabiya]
MAKVILGKKIGMTQVFSQDGRIIPVTAIEAGPCIIEQVKAEATDGYNAIQIGYGEIKNKNVNKAMKGHFAKAGTSPVRFLRELRVENPGQYQVGQNIDVSVFQAGDKVDVMGVSRGKGFAGTIKRWNFARGPMAHGSKNHRRPASAGAKGPARVFKGKKSPGRLGGARVTVQNLEVVKVDPERNLLLIKGAVPGPKQGLVMVKTAVKAG